ncbi:MAG: putative ABC exporter domain-containing protein [Defluviitaleaceae bacterium]|nr:putative ABC exporter domain-containing protein [Defluviitaleaceae bacterium]
MNAIYYLHVRSILNQIFEVIRSPKRLVKALGLMSIFVMFVLGAVSGMVVVSAIPTELPLLKGMMFMLFLIPFYVGRYGGIGPFSAEHMNFIFTAPILPRTVLLTELLQRLKDMLVVSLAIMAIFAFMGLTVAMEIRHIILPGVFFLYWRLYASCMGCFCLWDIRGPITG